MKEADAANVVEFSMEMTRFVRKGSGRKPESRAPTAEWKRAVEAEKAEMESRERAAEEVRE
jgi:hypothetical protein